MRKKRACLRGTTRVIEVADSGEGMDEETRKHIFEPFFTTKDKDKGTGLGMVMVRDYIKGLGGTVTIRSEIGIGTIHDPVYTAKHETV